jgi:hypothetical protein
MGRKERMMIKRMAGAAIATGMIALVALPAAASAKVPNVCHITGITKALGKKVQPEFDTFSNVATETTTPPNIGAFCELIPKTVYKAALEVELWDATYFQQQLPAFTGGLHKQSLRNLGKGAVYAYQTGASRNGNLLFEHGKYMVLIDTNAASGASSAFPTMKQWLTLAHAIYKHL